MFKSVSILSNKTYKLCATSLMCLLLNACMQSNASVEQFDVFVETDTRIPATDNTIKMVNAVFYQNFLGGDWRYQGSTRQNNSINAYIQIPEQLNMSKEAQHNYLTQAICPSANQHALWNEIKDTQLTVHIYTYKRKYSFYAKCNNPNIS